MLHPFGADIRQKLPLDEPIDPQTSADYNQFSLYPVQVVHAYNVPLVQMKFKYSIAQLITY